MMMTHGQAPIPTQVKPEWKDAILHARIDVGGAQLMGADIPGCLPMRSAYLSLGVDTDAEAERIWAALSEGGQALMPMQETFFASRFGQVKVKDARELYYTLGEPTSVLATNRSFSLGDFKRLIAAASDLKREIPRSRLNRLGAAPLLGYTPGTFEAIHLFTRCKEEERVVLRQAMEDFGCMQSYPWSKPGEGAPFSTVLTDLVEIADFLE